VAAVLDFTSALYLGLRHPSSSLRPWPQLTLGKPAALASPPGAAGVADELAALQGCERAALAPSTLHLFWDLFGLLARSRVRIYMDAGAYPIAKWGVERAAALGVPVRRFAHHDAAALRTLLARDRHAGGRPVIVADGFCPTCGGAAPLADYLRCVEDGHLVIDDTQALGILGEGASAAAPYGTGGGGSLRRQHIDPARVIVGSSLAKGFGVPVAVLAGSEAVIRRFEQDGETRVHSSPPSLAVIHAAAHALAVNRAQGDELRLRLARLVRRFRDGLGEIGLAADGGLFPVQTLRPAGIAPQTLYARLLGLGIRTVLLRWCGDIGARIAILITALHTPAEIDTAVAALASAFHLGGACLARSARIS
jgi:8-amino-7-oxononanoate synthase